jgi:hypothetical protein
MVNGTKFGSQFWLMNKNWPSKLVQGTNNVLDFWLSMKMVTNQK